MSSAPYDLQSRGNPDANASYWAAMDASMAQKVALCSAHFLLDPGARLADMGCGSGYGTYLMAALNPQATVIGVDINPEAIAYARDTWKLPNLTFIEADATEPVFAGDPVDGILSCSAFHHYYSFNGYSHRAVEKALANHMASLKIGGRMVLRDFIAPDNGDELVIIELPDDSGDDDSVCDLLSLFARQARALSGDEDRGFFLEEIVGSGDEAVRRFRLPKKWAVEFVLRKDYRADWNVELLEEYSYFTAGEMKSAFERAGARLVHLMPHQNGWIVRNRFEGRFRMLDEEGSALDWPATHIVAVADRTEAPIGFEERRQDIEGPSYFSILHLADEIGNVTDLVSRKEIVREVLPWRRDETGRLRVLARSNSPRPVVAVRPRGWSVLDRAYWSGHFIEPIATTDRNPREPLERIAGLTPDCFSAPREALSYFPSAGGLDEYVVSCFAELNGPVPVRDVPSSASMWSDAGQVREFDLQALLKAAQVGMLPEARLELNAYALLADLGETAEPWIGDKPDLSAAGTRTAMSLTSVLAGMPMDSFEPTTDSIDYLSCRRSIFTSISSGPEHGRRGEETALEFVLPTERSPNTAIILPVAMSDDGPLIGLERLSLAAPALRLGDSRYLAAPGYRLDKSIRTVRDCRAWLARCFHFPISPDSDLDIDYDVDTGLVQSLGQPWFASSGVTPERVFPFVLPATGDLCDGDLVYVPLSELIERRTDLRDAHLLITMFRLAHILAS